MTDVLLAPDAPAAARTPTKRLLAFARRRFANPGIAYNSGNWIALAAAAAAPVLGSHGGLRAAALGFTTVLAGDAAAFAVSLGSLTFFFGGARYDRAWARGAPPDLDCVRQGHALSAFGAACIGVGLALLAKTPLALFTALCGAALHALGKLGSAWRDEVWLFKALPLASRAPALVSVSVDICTATDWRRAVAPILLVVCNLVWARADMMLLLPTLRRAGGPVENKGRCP
jgi:hypothetical protein